MSDLLPHGGSMSRNMYGLVGWQPCFWVVNDFQIGCSPARNPFLTGFGLSWSRYRFDEIINCGIITQLISHFLSVASLPYATFVLAINVIGAELEYLTGHCDPSDIPCLSAFIRAACRSSSWQHGRMKSKKLPPQKPYASLRSAFGLPKNDPWSISRCIWFGRIWRGSRGKAYITDPWPLELLGLWLLNRKCTL